MLKADVVRGLHLQDYGPVLKHLQRHESEGPQVRLCDARSGAFTHELEGHTRAVWAVAWDPSSQWRLATGACDGQVTVTGSVRRVH